MFYSQTLLARKTALGTVWCAAHLQHRLNKKDYEKTKISVVVDSIMFGEVPLALRTSSYLLLGVVRIYSKQIDYLKHDVDVMVMELQKMHLHASAKLTLPENAYQAPFHSITLPETFDLDAFELDSDIYHDGIPDNHIMSQENITLTEQVPIGRDAYVAISFDEDIMIDSSHPGEAPDLGFESMEVDVLPPPPMDSTMNVTDFQNVQDFGPNNQGMHNGDNSPQHVPEVEVQVEAASDFSPKDHLLVPPVGGDAMAGPSHLIDENISRENLLPSLEDEITLPQSVRPTSATSPEALDMTDTRISFGARHSPMELVIQPTPPQLPKPRSRKRKRFFDESIVLTNEFIERALEDCSDLLREIKNAPSTLLDVWKLNNRLRKDEVFYHPSTTGLCHDLGDMFNMDYIATKCRLKSLEEASGDLGNAGNIASIGETIFDQADAPSPAPEVASSPHTIIPPTVDPAINIAPAGETFSPFVVAPSPDREAASSPHIGIPPTLDHASASFPEMEIERQRDVEGNRWDDILTNLVASPPRSVPSSRNNIPGDRLGIASTEPSKSVFETPGTINEGMGGENVTLPDVSELRNTADEELYFLEAENSPAGSQRTQRVDSLSVRTRAVGRYLMSLSPTKLISDDTTQDLCLNDILAGKRRKLCARMFYETLVLKSYGLIDVQQDVPYGDITLKLTPELSKAQI